MSLIIPDSLRFELSQLGSDALIAKKNLPINQVCLIDKTGYRLMLHAKANLQSSVLSVTFESSFIGEFAVAKIELFNDDMLMGVIVRIVKSQRFSIFTMQQGCIYINGFVADFVEDEYTLTINRYKGNSKPSQSNVPLDNSLSIIEGVIEVLGGKMSQNLISSEQPNQLTLGGDDKLLVTPNNETYLTQADW